MYNPNDDSGGIWVFCYNHKHMHTHDFIPRKGELANHKLNGKSSMRYQLPGTCWLMWHWYGCFLHGTCTYKLARLEMFHWRRVQGDKTACKGNHTYLAWHVFSNTETVKSLGPIMCTSFLTTSTHTFLSLLLPHVPSTISINISWCNCLHLYALHSHTSAVFFLVCYIWCYMFTVILSNHLYSVIYIDTDNNPSSQTYWMGYQA